MQLKIKRSQRQGGMLGGKLLWGIDARIQLSAEESQLVDKYGLGNLSVYDSEARKKQSQAAMNNFDTAANTNSGLGRQFAGLAIGAVRASMAAFTLRVTINSLVSGQRVECKDLDEALGAEAAIREACQTVKSYLETAKSFDGREEVIEI